MGETIVQDVAATRSGQAIPRIEKNQAVSFLVPFAAVKQLLVGYPAPGRPNRKQPVNVVDPELREELDAWEAASDEAFESLEEERTE